MNGRCLGQDDNTSANNHDSELNARTRRCHRNRTCSTDPADEWAGAPARDFLGIGHA